MNSITVELTDSNLWAPCLEMLRQRLVGQQFDTWLKPLQSRCIANQLWLYAPNQFVQEHVNQHFLEMIQQILHELYPQQPLEVLVTVGDSLPGGQNLSMAPPTMMIGERAQNGGITAAFPQMEAAFDSKLNSTFTFGTFVEGKSNQLAKAAAEAVAASTLQIGTSDGSTYNPLLLYGASGLGKTHLMHAVGNAMLQQNPSLKVLYLHSERFVSEMIRALQTNTIGKFKDYYRGLDAIFIDDIQFFAGKDRTQEEFFHLFNGLFEKHRQMIFTCDRYPKEIEGLEERLKSRFGWGLTVAIEPPELETRVAILLNKAQQSEIEISSEVAFFIAKRIRSNVRELEGALKRVIASARFTGQAVTLEFVRETLKDLIALQDRLVTIDNIQKTVADYYKIKVSDLLSKRRNRSVTRPRQVAMALAKELTNRSLPEIGDAFGGRDHTTVLHACRLIEDLKKTQTAMAQDIQHLLRLLST